MNAEQMKKHIDIFYAKNNKIKLQNIAASRKANFENQYWRNIVKTLVPEEGMQKLYDNLDLLLKNKDFTKHQE